MLGNARLRDVTEADITVWKLSEWRWLVWSLALAAAALGSEYLALTVQKPQPSQYFLVVGVFCTLAWVIVLIVAAFRLRWRSIWLLLTSPIALFVPAYIGWIIYEIDVSTDDCVGREQHQRAAMLAANPHLDPKTLLFLPCGPDF